MEEEKRNTDAVGPYRNERFEEELESLKTELRDAQVCKKILW
tara:strand:+ start:711 stop:836 length:126 start_codon:yes stop_codon:yes gene_type:complete